MQIDYISDLHLDFYIKHNGNYEKWKLNTNSFLHSLLPDLLGNILVVAGDISHYNIQSFWTIEYFRNIYEHVFYVSGNHDFYLISRGQNKKYKNRSLNREIELKEMISVFNNVTFLKHFEVHNYKGIKIAGSTSWYPLTEARDYFFFKDMSNDSAMIKNFDIGNENFIESEKYKEIEVVDILVTHIPPIIIDSHHKYGGTSCYLNELSGIKANHNIFGHCHEQTTYNKVGYKFYINALGYPMEWASNMDLMSYSFEDRIEFRDNWNKIKSFKL